MGFGWFPLFLSKFLRLYALQNWITHHANPSPCGTSVGGSLKGSACNGFHIGLMKLILLSNCLKNQQITLRIQRNKGNPGIKCQKYPRKQGILEVYSTDSAWFSNYWQFRDSVLLKELHHGFCHWTTVVAGKISKKMPFTSSFWSEHHTSIVQHGAHNLIPNITATLTPTLAKSNGLIFNLGLQKPPPWWLSHPKFRTIRMHACSFFEGITSTAVTKLCFGAAWARWQFWSAAILDCIIEIDGNHAMIWGNQTCLHRASEWHLHP